MSQNWLLTMKNVHIWRITKQTSKQTWWAPLEGVVRACRGGQHASIKILATYIGFVILPYFHLTKQLKNDIFCVYIYIYIYIYILPILLDIWIPQFRHTSLHQRVYCGCHTWMWRHSLNFFKIFPEKKIT